MSNLRSYFDVIDYGAAADGTTDDSTAIQNAINAASAAGGGIVYLPTGTYYLAYGLLVSSSNVGIRGAGVGSLLKAGHQGHILNITNELSHLLFEDFAVDAVSQMPSGTSAIMVFNGIRESRFANLHLSPYVAGATTRLWNAIYLSAYDRVTIENVQIFCSGAGITATNNATGWSGDAADLFITGGCDLRGHYTAGSVGLHLGGGNGGVHVIGANFAGFETGIQFSNSLAWKDNRETFLTNCVVDSSGNNGIQISGDITGPPAASPAVHLQIANSWVANSGVTYTGGWPYGSGLVTLSSPLTTTVSISGSRFVKNRGFGVAILDGFWDISGCVMEQNQVGLWLLGPQDATNISGNLVALNTQYGIVVSGGVNNYAITGNVVRSNPPPPATANNIVDSGSTPKLVANNL
jgi:hypothetical protein